MALAQSQPVSYQRPDWVARRIVNPILMYAAKHFGLGVDGACVLCVRGRRTGLDREVVIHVLNLEGQRYLVAPRGETEWVRNLRQAEAATLSLGGVQQVIHANVVPDEEKPPILRAYLRRWARTGGRYFDVPDGDVGDSELERIAPAHPVFRLTHR
jgi:deazaflavin-dependent oxidoreductase (nitroreductase family)